MKPLPCIKQFEKYIPQN